MNNNNYLLSLKLGELLKFKALKLAVAESCTGGGLAAELTAVPGASAYFERGFVTYSNEAKHELLDVPMDLITAHGAVSSEVAGAMAAGVIAHSHADIAISITGVAGPGGGTAQKPVGLVYFGLAIKGQAERVSFAQFDGDRSQVRHLAISYALESLLEMIIASI